jgi:hypothetical protein
MKREEAEALVRQLAAEHPDRATHRWLAQEVDDHEWRVVKLKLPGQRGPLTEEVRADPTPMEPPNESPGPFFDEPSAG